MVVGVSYLSKPTKILYNYYSLSLLNFSFQMGDLKKIRVYLLTQLKMVANILLGSYYLTIKTSQSVFFATLLETVPNNTFFILE